MVGNVQLLLVYYQFVNKLVGIVDISHFMEKNVMMEIELVMMDVLIVK